MLKESCPEKWKSYPEVTEKLIKLGELPSKESADLVFQSLSVS